MEFHSAKRLTEEHNKKAEEFNSKLKSQTKKNPLTTTGDYLINPETDITNIAIPILPLTLLFEYIWII